MLRVTTEMQGPPGAPFYTTMYFAGTTEGEASAAVAAVAAFWGDLTAEIAAGTTWTVFGEVEVVDPVTGNITGTFSDPDVSNAFTNSADPLPWSSQILIRWRTGVFVAGREIRGRTFLPGFTEAASDNGQVESGVVSGLQTPVDDLLTAASGAGGLAVYSPTNGQAALVSNGSVWNQFAILRSRRD